MLLALTMLFWSGSVVVGRAAADLVPPVLFTALRWSGALLIAVPFAWPHIAADWRALWARKWIVALLSLLGVVAYNILVYRALQSTTAVNALLMQSVTPLAVLFATLLLFRERTGWVQIAAIVVSVLGVLVIAAGGSLETLRSMTFNFGDGLVLLAVVVFAVYSAVLRLRPAVHPLSFLAATFVIGLMVLVPLAILEYQAGARLVASLPAFLAILYAGVFASFLAILFYNRGVELVGATRAGQFSHLQPVFGTLLAVGFLSESLQLHHFAGITLIAAGLVLANYGAIHPSPDA